MTPTSLRGRTAAGRVVLASLVVAASFAACSGPGGGGSGDSSASSSASGSSASPDPSGTGGGSGSGGGGGNGGNGGDDGFAYMPWGPTDPPIPDQYAALAGNLDTAPSCNNPVGGDFWDLAAAVCRAITAGGDWPTATTVPSPPDPENAYQACLNDELTAMLSAALRWHADNPDRRPEVTFPGGSTISPCQARVYEVSVLSDADSPISGENEVPVAVVYSGRGAAGDVTVDGQPPEDFADDSGPGDGANTLIVLVPLQSDPHAAEIAFTTGFGPLSASVQVPGNGGSGSTSSGSESPSDGTSAEPSETSSP